jgi:hypothetical protein
MNSGEVVRHSFEQGGKIFDCVPIMEQASVRVRHLQSLALAPPRPPKLRDLSANSDAPRFIKSSLDGSLDRFGNSISCERGTVPTQRIAIEDIARYPTLDDFFRKDREARRFSASVTTLDHAHVHAFQAVNNWGGLSAINLWRPQVNFPLGEWSSISQEWYFGGSNAQEQTAEVGWVNGKYGLKSQYSTEDSELFIFYTANGYGYGGKQIKGCWNKECAAFMQTNYDWCLGCTFPHYSTTQGTQYEVHVGYQLYQGNWWLDVNGEWIGYYPGTLYEGGQLSKNALYIDYGGETISAEPWWPFMGSGHFASTRYKSAAYHRLMQYWDSAGRLHTASLSGRTNATNCYTIDGPYDGGASWGQYFFFGGPGGKNCKDPN